MRCSSQTVWTSTLDRSCSTSSNAPAASTRWRRRRGEAPNMTSFELETVAFEDDIVASMERMHPRFEDWRSEEHTSELQSRGQLVCRLLLAKKKSHTCI